MKVTPFIMDGGNVEIKTAAPTGVVKEDHFPHAFVPMRESDYQRVAGRTSTPDDDYFLINGKPYAFGEKGLRHGRFERQHGAQRYTPEYYGVFLAAAMTRAFGRSVNNIFLMGSHAPQDVDYAHDLMESACREWVVEWRGKVITLKVVDASTFDEPLGGWANAILRKDGKGYANKRLNDGITLTLDIGGYTTDGLVVDQGGAVDYSTALSADIGVLAAVQQFTRDFRTQNSGLLKEVKHLDERKVHMAIRTGIMDLRGMGEFECHDLAQEIRNSLAGQVESFFKLHYGDNTAYDYILLTGGGSALIESELREYIGHRNMILAEDNLAYMQMANVRGGEKWYKMHEALGTFA